MGKSLKAHSRKKQKHMPNEISFRSNNALESHNKIHTIDKPLHSCTKCSKKFNKTRDLKQHFRLTHAKLEQEVSSVGDIKHTHNSTDKETSDVSEAQNSLINVKGNQNNYHPTYVMEQTKNSTAPVPTGEIVLPSQPELTPYKGQIYYCNSCGQRFISSDGLERHKKIQHSGKSLYICKKCNEQFNTFQRLNKHFRRTHTKWGEEMITLSINKVSNIKNGDIPASKQSSHNESEAQNEMPNLSENEISNHLKDITEHQKNKSTVPHSEVFSSQPELTPHERRKTFKYFCNSCSKSFKSIHELQMHKRIHIDKSCNICATCNEQFDTFELVKKHFLHTHAKREQEDSSDDDVECNDNECRNIPNSTRIKNLKKKITKNFKRIIARELNTTEHPANTRSRVKADIRKLNAVTPNVAIQSGAIPKRGFVKVSVPDAKVATQNSKATFHVIKTKPNVQASALNTQDSLPCKLLTKNAVDNAKTITEDGNALNIATQVRSSVAKTPTVLSISILRNTSATVLYTKPDVTNRQSKVPYIIPNLTTAKANNKPDADLRNTTAIVENALPDMKKTRRRRRRIEKSVCKYCGVGFVKKIQLNKYMMTHNKWQISKIRDATDTSTHTHGNKITDDVYSEKKETNDNFVLKNDVYSSDVDSGEIMDDVYKEEDNDIITDTAFINGNYSENEGKSAIVSEEIRDINTVGVIDEVCLDLVEESSVINAQLDSLSVINDDKELLKRRNIEPMLIPSLIPEQIIKVKKENFGLIPEQNISLEEEIVESILARRVKREESVHLSPDEIINIKYECISPLLEEIPSIKDENIELVPTTVKREAIIPILPEQIVNTEGEIIETIETIHVKRVKRE